MAVASVLTDETVTIYITSTATSFSCEKRFPKSLTISEFKFKLEVITGCHASSMSLELYGLDDKFIQKLNNDQALLGSHHIDNGMRIHVVDPSRKMGEFEDVSKVEKYEMSDADYAQRADTFWSFKEKNKIGQFKQLTDEEIAKQQEAKLSKEAEEKERFNSFKLEDRCQVNLPNTSSRLGCIKYLGKLDFKEGLFVGVQYDEPLGRNDGSIDGKYYFKCTPKYGNFVRPCYVTAGDFPEDDLGLGDDDEM